MANVGNGPSTYVLTGNGTNAPPTWQPASGGGGEPSFFVNIGPEVDFTMTGTTTLFTPSSDFFLFGITFTCIDITGSTTPPVFNIGFNATDYDNILSASTLYGNQTDFTNGGSIGNQFSETPFIPAGTPLIINITTQDITATTNVQQIDVQGYYLDGSSGSGGVTGPGTSTNRSISTWNGTTGAALFDNPTTDIDSSGRLTNTGQPAFRAVQTTDISSVTGDGSSFTITYNGPDQNGTAFNGTTGVFTAPVTGFYLFISNIGIDGLSVLHTTIFAYINHNSTSEQYIISEAPVVGSADSNGIACVKGSVMLRLTAGDTVSSIIQVAGSSKSINILGGENSGPVDYYTYFCGYLVC